MLFFVVVGFEQLPKDTRSLFFSVLFSLLCVCFFNVCVFNAQHSELSLSTETAHTKKIKEINTKILSHRRTSLLGYQNLEKDSLLKTYENINHPQTFHSKHSNSA